MLHSKGKPGRRFPQLPKTSSSFFLPSKTHCYSIHYSYSFSCRLWWQGWAWHIALHLLSFMHSPVAYNATHLCLTQTHYTSILLMAWLSSTLLWSLRSWKVWCLLVKLMHCKNLYIFHHNPYESLKLREYYRLTMMITMQSCFCTEEILKCRDPSERPTAKQALQHEWLKDRHKADRASGPQLDSTVVQRIQVRLISLFVVFTNLCPLSQAFAGYYWALRAQCA